MPIRQKPWFLFTTFALAAALLCRAPPAGGASPGGARLLPDVPVHSLTTSKDVSLFKALAGRPAIILVSNGSGTATCPLARAAADLQRDYAPWFTWVAVLSGPLTITDPEPFTSASPARFDRLYLDRAGAVPAALGLLRLPALLIVDEDGAVHESCTPEGGAARLQEVATKLQVLAEASRRRRAGFQDFRLPQVGRKELSSFLDVAGREKTMLSFVNSGSLACARLLEVLDFARVREAGRVSFVTVFLDDASDARIRGFLAAAGAAPDHVLRDPELRLAARYAISAIPTLLVIDAAGSIVLSRGGYREEGRDRLYRDLERVLADEAPPEGFAGRALREARRIHAEACTFLREGKPEYALIYQERIREMLPGYASVHVRVAEAALASGRQELAIRSLARYLAAEPMAYGSADIRRKIAGLMTAGP